MLFVLPAVLFWGLFALAIWFFVFRTAVKKERVVADAKKRDARFEQLLCTPNEPLHCLCCQVSFWGPLPERGCPKCNTGAFVIPVQTSDDPAVRASTLVPPPTTVGGAPQEPAETRMQARIGFRQSGVAAPQESAQTADEPLQRNHL